MSYDSLVDMINSVQDKRIDQFEQAFKENINEKILERIEAKRLELAQNFFHQPINEDCMVVVGRNEKRNIIDGLKKIVDLRKPGVIETDNGDQLTVDVKSAEKLVNFFNLHDEKQQFHIQRRMRVSAHEFLNVAAKAAADISEVVSNGEIK